MDISEIKCIYCKKKLGGMICTGKGYSCVKCLLETVDKLQFELDILRPKFKAADECCTEREITILGHNKAMNDLREVNRIIWCHLSVGVMLQLTASKISHKLPPAIDYIRKSQDLECVAKKSTVLLEEIVAEMYHHNHDMAVIYDDKLTCLVRDTHEATKAADDE